MSAESARLPIGADAAPRATSNRSTAPSGGGSLTRRAALTAIASVLDYGAQIAITLLVTPLVVGRLGGSLFGVWEMLRQAVGYMSAADGRPMDALRLVVASEQGSGDQTRLRQNVGAALGVWLVFFPVAALAGTLIVWLAPAFTTVAPEMHGAVRLAAGLLVTAFIALALAAIPEAVLRGMNLGYKRMGWQAALSVAGGLLTAGAVYLGFGLVGLGAAQLTLALLTGVCFLLLVRRYVPAFGVGRPSRQEAMKLLRMSAWITGGLVLTNLLLASDVLILGMVVSPEVVTTYVLTGAAARMAVTLFNFTVGATTPGLGGVIGQRDMERAARVRAELVTMTWLFVTVGGATILLWNHSFVSLWVGSQHYAGAVENLLIVAVMAQTAFIRGDAFVIDAALRPRPRVIVTAIAAVLSVGATLALTPAFGIVGLCIGILIGRLPQTVAYPVLVASCLRKPGGSGMSSAAPLAWVSRPRLAIKASGVLHGARRAVVMIGMLTAAAWLGQRMVAGDWLTWIGGAAATVILALAVAIAAGLTGETRRAVIGRGLAMARTFRA